MKCPCCGEPVEDHPDNGCVLNTLLGVLRDRGSLEEADILDLHAKCDVDALWQDLGRIIDRLEDGRYL